VWPSSEDIRYRLAHGEAEYFFSSPSSSPTPTIRMCLQRVLFSSILGGRPWEPIFFSFPFVAVFSDIGPKSTGLRERVLRS